MNRLEIKHLSPYLPYGLKVKYSEGVHYNEFPFNRIDSIDPEGVRISGIELWVLFQNIKPILRSLSDLTKEIEHNGERFVPLEELKRVGLENIYVFEDLSGKSHLCLDENNRGPGYTDLMLFGLAYYRDKAIEWHFDVFGLIEKGLAININDIEI